MRTILHSDCNNFFASVECVLHPEFKGHPLAVCGAQELRHGIVLAKNEQAKAFGVSTGDTIWQARKKCPGLQIITPHHHLYGEFSRRMRAIYLQYTDQVEPFGLDECFLDVTGCAREGVQIAAEIRRRARQELGITASVGVSFNKIFAKLGSDMRKPDATTVITADNFREKIWPLSAGNLLFVGAHTQSTLARFGIYTIGDVARADEETLRCLLGKQGAVMRRYALGLDDAPVLRPGEEEAAKSIGNSTTLPRDVEDEAEAQKVLHTLCDQVAERLRRHTVKCGMVALWVRDSALNSFERQCILPEPTCLSGNLFGASLSLLRSGYTWHRPIRSLGVRTGRFTSLAQAEQQTLFPDPAQARREALERAIDAIREKQGPDALRRAVQML